MRKFAPVVLLLIATQGVAAPLSAQDVLFEKWIVPSPIPGVEMEFYLYRFEGRACGYEDEYASGRVYRHRFSGRSPDYITLHLAYECNEFEGRCSDQQTEEGGGVLEMWRPYASGDFMICRGRLELGTSCSKSNASYGDRRSSATLGLAGLRPDKPWIAQCLTDSDFPQERSRLLK